MPTAVTQPRPTASQRGTSGVYERPSYHRYVRLEPTLAGLVTLGGIGLTSAGIFAHLPMAVAPGALLILVGGACLGNSLARLDVRVVGRPTREAEA
jgi:hypothetical protein